VVVANLDERRGGQPTVPDQFLAVGERHNVVGPWMQDRGVLLDSPGGVLPLPGRAEQDEWGVAAVEIYGYGTAPSTAFGGKG
jgi:hypothetical protein